MMTYASWSCNRIASIYSACSNKLICKYRKENLPLYVRVARVTLFRLVQLLNILVRRLWFRFKWFLRLPVHNNWLLTLSMFQLHEFLWDFDLNCALERNILFAVILTVQSIDKVIIAQQDISQIMSTQKRYLKGIMKIYVYLCLNTDICK